MKCGRIALLHAFDNIIKSVIQLAIANYWLDFEWRDVFMNSSNISIDLMNKQSLELMKKTRQIYACFSFHRFFRIYFSHHSYWLFQLGSSLVCMFARSQIHSLDTQTYSIIEYSTGHKNSPSSYRIQCSLVNIEKEREKESEKAIERIFENVRMYSVFPFCESVYTRLSGV